MNTLKRNMTKAGYDLEEIYFFEREQELIKKMRTRPRLQLIQGGLSNDSRVRSDEDKKGAA